MNNKELIKSRFTKALASYDKNAQVQRLIAEQMIEFVHEILPEADKIAEFGCGTGIYTQLLAETFQPSQLWINDLCCELSDYYSTWDKYPVDFHAGDIEKQTIPTGQNLITGCSVMQWLENEMSFINRCYNSLTTEGVLAFSSFGCKNLREVRHLTGIGLDYYTRIDYERMLRSRFQVVCSCEKQVTLHFKNAKAVLRHLKDTGVTGISNVQFTRPQLARFCQEYERKFSDSEGVRLTYHPIYIVAKVPKDKYSRNER